MEEKKIKEEKVKKSEQRRRDLEVELEVAVRESVGLREQVSRMELRIEELEAEVCASKLRTQTRHERHKTNIYI